MIRLKSIIALLFACHALPVAPVAADELTVIAWNVESGGADPQVIAQRIAEFDGCDLWGLAEVNDASWVAQFEVAAEFEEEADFDAITGRTGGPSGQEFLFVVNQLDRVNDEGRHEQARRLNEWAAQQALPIICCGEMNFDWSVGDRGRTRDRGFDLMTANGTFRWVRPDRLEPTHDSRDNSILDFIFVAGVAPWSRARCEIIVERGDFPDDETTSDHRPVLGQFDFRDVVTATTASEAITLRQQILERIEKIEAELAELRELVEQLGDGR
ncbi:MAG: exonuclease/endonuclease/phosphatase family protein [Planctomycetota bacterium]|jgi:hypothetical protein